MLDLFVRLVRCRSIRFVWRCVCCWPAGLPNTFFPAFSSRSLSLPCSSCQSVCGIQFTPYDPRISALLHAIPNSSYQREEKMWCFPLREYENVISSLRKIESSSSASRPSASSPSSSSSERKCTYRLQEVPSQALTILTRPDPP